MVSIKNLTSLKKSYLLEKTLVLPIICSKCKKEEEKLFKKRRINGDIKSYWFN